MAKEYYLQSGDQKLGPFTEAQISAALRSGKVSLFDFIFNQQSNSWVMVMSHPDFCDSEYVSSDNLQGEETHIGAAHSLTVGLIGQDFTVNSNASIENEIITEMERAYWFEKSNPLKAYKYLDVVSLIHKGFFSEHTLISQSSEGPWKPVVEWDEFSVSSLTQYKKVATKNIPEIYMRRQHPRFDLGKVFIFFIHGSAFKAFCPDISKVGLSFIVQNDRADVDDVVYVKFSDESADQTFDAKAVVVGFRKIRVADTGKVYIRYSLRFTHLSEPGKQKLSAWTNSP